jgi:hypothetical protein
VPKVRKLILNLLNQGECSVSWRRYFYMRLNILHKSFAQGMSLCVIYEDTQKQLRQMPFFLCVMEVMRNVCEMNNFRCTFQNNTIHPNQGILT